MDVARRLLDQRAVGIVTVAVTLIGRPDGRVARGQRLDVKGVVTLVPGLVAIVLALMQSTTWGWDSALTWGLLIGGCVLLVVFVFIELRVRQPLVELALFRIRNFLGDNRTLFCVQFALIGLTVFGAIYVQDILGFSSIEAGLSLLPVTVPLLLTAPLAGRIYDRIGPRALVATGAGLVGASLFFVGALLGELNYWLLVPGYIGMGIGIGLVMGPSNTDAMNAAGRVLRGQASGVVQTVRQVGGAVGLAIMGTVVVNVQHSRIEGFLGGLGASPTQIHELENALAQEPAQQQEVFSRIPPAEQAQVVDGLKDAVVAGISWAYYVGGIAAIFACVVAAVLLRRQAYDEAEEAGEAASAFG